MILYCFRCTACSREVSPQCDEDYRTASMQALACICLSISPAGNLDVDEASDVVKADHVAGQTLSE